MKRLWRFWPLRITLIYFIVSALWIVFSDSILNRLTGSLAAASIWQTYKGLFFITATSALIFGLTYTVFRQKQQALKELEASRQGFSILFSNHPQPMWVYDLETARFLAVNEAAVARYGYSADEFQTMSLFDICPENEVERLKKALETPRMMLQESGIWQHQDRKGILFPVQITSHTLEFGGRSAVLVQARDVSAEVEAFQALEHTRREQADLQEIINRSPIVVIRWGNQPGWPIELVSDGISQFGYSKTELLKAGFLFIHLIHPEDQERVKQEVAYYLDHRQDEFRQEYRLLNSRGEVCWVEDLTLVRRDENGEIVYFQGILLDSTARKQSELNLRETFLALQESEERLRQYIDFLPDPTLAVDPNGKVTIWNRALEEFSGVRREEILGKDYHVYSPLFYRQAHPMLVDLALEADHKKLKQFYPGVKIEGNVLIGEVEMPDFRGGITVWAKAAPLRDAQGQLTGALEVIRDITERVKAEKELRSAREALEERVAERTRELNQANLLLKEKLQALEEMEQTIRTSELRLRGILDSSSAIIYLYNLQDQFMFINRQFETAFQVSQEDILGKTPGEVFPGYDSPLIENNARVREEACPLQFTETLALPDGMHTYLSTKFPLFDAAGKIYGVGGISADITEREQMERELKETHLRLQAAFDELEAFSYSVSHDLRAPLRRIDGFCQALVEDYQNQLDPTARHYLKRIRSGVQQMAALIDALLQLSRLNKMELNIGRVDLVRLCREIQHELMQLDPKRAVNFYHPEELIVYGDEKLLRIAMRNLMDNAWKFTVERNVAEISLSEERREGQRLICLRDNGIGFDPKYTDQLFIAFQRLHDPAQYPGSGIGLATVKRIIHRHGGMIWAEGNVNEGAAFYFTLPGKANG